MTLSSICSDVNHETVHKFEDLMLMLRLNLKFLYKQQSSPLGNLLVCQHKAWDEG